MVRDVPQVTDRIYELRKEGGNLPQDMWTEDECYEAIKSLSTKEGGLRHDD